MDDGVDNAWALLYEDGNFGHLEMVNFYDPNVASDAAAYVRPKD
jgi:hypothetical protein